MSCAICEKRKEKRFCPAIHGRICPQCCGENREVTLECPSECVYLRQARQYEKPRPLTDLDQADLFPTAEIDEQFVFEHEHLLVGINFALMKSAKADASAVDPKMVDPKTVDRDLIAALFALAKTYETLANSGLHYATPASTASRQATAGAVQKMITEYRDAEQKHTGYSRLRDSEVFKALVFILRVAYSRTSGRPKSRAFADFLSDQFPEKDSPTAGQEEVSRIIAP